MNAMNLHELVTNCMAKSNCVRKQVGAVLLREGEIISSGWNGVALFVDCREAGCLWCSSDGPLGMGFDRCICRHAEQAAIGDAARRGIATDGATMYSSLRPCMNCMKLALMCGIAEVYFDERWDYKDHELEESYATLANQFSVFKCVNK